jgi:Na+:H+ antiporter, NhaA family
VVVALVWANAAPTTYATVWTHPLGGGVFPQLATVRDWVNAALMALFFFVVGLEIGRERRHGALREGRTALVPVAGALGGMAGAALVFAAVNHGGAGARGWSVPMATDIAFAVGVLALLGRRIPPGLRVLLLALAVADDVGSLVVLAAVSSSQVVWGWAGAAAAVAVALIALARWPRVPVAGLLAGGVVLWVTMAGAGIEPALAGAVVGVLVPDRVPRRVGDSTVRVRRRGPEGRPAEALERLIAPWSAFVVLPVFAVANAGITFRTDLLGPPGAAAVFGGVVAARVVGKILGITAACALVVRTGAGQLPRGVRWPHVVGGAAVAGIGLTVPLLMAEVVFAAHPPLIAASELGLLVGSTVAAVIGVVILLVARPWGVTKEATTAPTTGPEEEAPPGIAW